MRLEIRPWEAENQDPKALRYSKILLQTFIKYHVLLDFADAQTFKRIIPLIIDD